VKSIAAALGGKRRLITIALATATLVAVACGGNGSSADVPADDQPPTPPADGGTAGSVLVADVDRAPAGLVDARSAADAVNAFAADVYGLLSAQDGNLVFSPYSAAVALTMALNGARGETAAQMEAVLHADLAGDLNTGFNGLDAALAQRPATYDRGDGTTDSLELATANALWGQDGVAFLDVFLETLAATYGAGLRIVDFVADTEGARQTINDWVGDQTRTRIPELIPRGVLSSDTRLVLTNAIYLKAPWLIPFRDGATTDLPFHRLDGSSVDVPLMQLGAKLQYTEGDGYQAFELPYINSELAMLVVVPDEGSFSDVEASLGPQTLAGIARRLSEAQVNLRFPKFEFRTQLSLSQTLGELGMPLAFTGAADFSGITGSRGLFISAVIHEAFIAVDEQGTEAAAATAVAFDASAAALFVELDVDRPFLFAIRDLQTGVVLFLGRIVDPSS